jgi:hypothetical protein
MHPLIKLIAVLGLIALAQPLHAQDATAPQSWASSDGKAIQAKFIKLEGEFVTLELNGQQHKFPLARLSPESMALAKKLSGASPAPAAPLSPTGAPSAVPDALLPTNFLGKTFEECEKALGAPTKIENPEGKRRSFERHYQVPVKGISQVRLLRVPVGNSSGPVSERVNFLRYHFPKGSIKNMGEAFRSVGLSMAGASIFNATDSSWTWDTPFADSGSVLVSGIKGDLEARWTTASESMTRVSEELRHPDEDSLTVNEKYKPGDGDRKGIVIAGDLKFDLSVTSDGRSFFGRNNESEDMTEVQMTVYPHPSKPGEISPTDESYSNGIIKKIKANGPFQNPPNVFKNAKNARLSDCSGMVKITAKVAGGSKSVTIDLTEKIDNKSN